MDAAAGLAELYVDGVKVIDVNGINTASYGNAVRVDFGVVNAAGVQKSLTVYGDCVVFSRAAVGTEAP
jgi:hypothetical protein